MSKGGVNLSGSQCGWLNMEIVLANGTIVQAKAISHPDLFWALKGGSSNYGIVTRFDVKNSRNKPKRIVKESNTANNTLLEPNDHLEGRC